MRGAFLALLLLGSRRFECKISLRLDMGSATTWIRILVSSAFVALVAALILVRDSADTTEPELNNPSSVGLADSVQLSRPATPSLTTPAANNPVPDFPSRTYVRLPSTPIRRAAIVDHCFTSEVEVILPASPRETAVVNAALGKDWKRVWRMLDGGASVESADDAGTTPLMAAAMQGDPGVIRTLLKRHANANSRDLSGRTALFYAVQSGKMESIQAVLPFASNMDVIAMQGTELLKAALETGNMNIFETILERLPPTLEWTTSTRAALQEALQADLKDQVRLLLSKHLAPPTPEGGKVPLIAYAIASDDAQLFHTLLACGSDPNIVVPQAAETEFMSLIKSRYLRLYIQEETGINLLMLAAGLGKEEYVRALLDAGADRRRSTPREKMLPLYFAAWTENWHNVQMLLGGGPMPEELRVEISLSQQSISVIKDGMTVYTTRCSTGREGFTTPAGNFVITDKDRDHRSTIYKVPMPYFMRLSCRDFGMHEGVVRAYPASHGCIRLPAEAARKLFTEIPIGTVVMIN